RRRDCGVLPHPEIAHGGAGARDRARERHEPADAADDEVRVDHAPSAPANAARTDAASTPATETSLSRPEAPRTSRTAEGGTPSARPRKRASASFAAPSTGGALSRTTSAPCRTPASPSFAARGCTRTRSVVPEALSRSSRAKAAGLLPRGLLAPLQEAQ